MISIAILDDHPALRAGLGTVIKGEPGLTVVGAVGTVAELRQILAHRSPDVVLVDYHLPEDDGLIVCREIKRAPNAPRVLLYSAYAGGALAVAATLAGADGLVGKGVPARELYDAIRRVARGERVGPPIPVDLVREAAARLNERDRAILGMALGDEPGTEISAVGDLDINTVDDHVERIIRCLRIEVPDYEA